MTSVIKPEEGVVHTADAGAPAIGAQSAPNSPVERVDMDDGTDDQLDDLAITGDLIKMVRLERMASNHFWGAVYLRDGRDLRLSFYVEKRSLKVTAEWEGRRPVRSEATIAAAGQGNGTNTEQS